MTINPPRTSRGGFSVGSGGGVPQTGSYSINSEAGINIANSMTPGSTFTAKDGSKWTKNADGTVSVLHQGVNTPNAQIGTLPQPAPAPDPYADEINAITAEINRLSDMYYQPLDPSLYTDEVMS